MNGIIFSAIGVVGGELVVSDGDALDKRAVDKRNFPKAWPLLLDVEPVLRMRRRCLKESILFGGGGSTGGGGRGKVGGGGGGRGPDGGGKGDAGIASSELEYL